VIYTQLLTTTKSLTVVETARRSVSFRNVEHKKPLKVAKIVTLQMNTLIFFYFSYCNG